jgi:hypothetical protein
MKAPLSAKFGLRKPARDDQARSSLIDDSVPRPVSLELTNDEAQELRKCEKVIETGWDTFVQVGLALSRIRDARLYRATCGTFQEYCRQKWHYGHSKAYYLISAAQIVTHLSTIVDIPKPTHESQVRPLIGLPEEKVAKVWKQAATEANGHGITAKLVNEIADRVRPPSGKKRRQPESRAQAGYIVQKLLMELERLIRLTSDASLHQKFVEIEEAFREYRAARRK